ncbi:MAG: pyruvate dehydrogenase complex dihydrolipoamide acetyltransferase, partial [Rhodospirillaceae bacterium]|nr:pyruvate dehydrogenase complex dihydrolipoamide acetyltransferase [Rhodospirillaceae bacterium]
MPIAVTMPALSPTMEEGTLARWAKQEGDAVGPGDVIAEIETDKATMEVEAVDEGVLGRIVVPEGSEGVKVNAVIAWLLEEGEDASALPADDSGAPVPGGGPEAAPEVRAPETAAAPAAAEASVAAPPPAEAPAAREPAGESGRVAASPLARRMAKQAGLDLAAIAGSGPHGRVVKRDIEQALAAGPPAERAPAPEA